jgi:hypothetical protein
MERKTKVAAGTGQQDILISREFDLPVALLFKAYTDPGLYAQWMSTKVLKMDIRPHGSWSCETTSPDGSVVLRMNGTVHACVPVQLEFLGFEALPDNRSRLNMQIVYRSEEDRNRQLQLPFAAGLNMAHDRLQTILNAFN